MKITTRFLASFVILALLALASPPSAHAALEAQFVDVALLPQPVTIASATATNIITVVPNKTLKLQPAQNVGVSFNFAGSGASTSELRAYFKYRSGDKAAWSSTLIAVTNTLAGTAQVSSTVVLTSGTHFPSTATELRLQYITNVSGVTAYLTNLTAGTWQTLR